MMSGSFNVMDVREDEIKIEGKTWDHDDLRVLSAKKILQFQKMVDYWNPLIRRGRKYENFFNGRILTDFQRQTYEEIESKIVLEPPLMKAPIRALVGQVLKSRKSGQVTTERNTASASEGGEAEIETLNVVMKDIETKTLEEYRIKEAIQSAFVSCYWNVLMFDRVSPSRSGDGVRYKMSHLPWSSCVFGPQAIKESDGSDIKELFYFDYRTVADLIDNYPEMEKQIVDHFNVGKGSGNDLRRFSSVSQWENDLSAADRDTMYDVINHATDALGVPGGLAKVVMHLFPVIKKQEVWVNIFDETGETYETRPPEWDDERWERWVRENAQVFAGPVVKETVMLWNSVFTTSGLMLANGPHWYQENGSLPCSFWLGAIDGNMPTGPAADMADSVLGACVAGIEQLSDLRSQSGRFALVKEGAVKYPETLAKEMSMPLGVSFVDKNFPGTVHDAIHEFARKASSDWGEYEDSKKQEMYEITKINETMMGQTATRQSAIAKQFEMDQALTVNATYVDNINRSWEAHQNLKLKLIAYLYTEWETIEARDDETGQMMQVEVNAPAGYDEMGNTTGVINNLSAHRYKWKINPVDDSATARARHNEDALMIINAAAGPLAGADPTGGLLAEFLKANENPVLQRFGKFIAERSEQMQQAAGQMEQEKLALDKSKAFMKGKADLLRAEKHGLMLNGTFEDVQTYPALYELYIQLQDIFSKKADEELAEAQQLAAPQQQEAAQMGQAV